MTDRVFFDSNILLYAGFDDGSRKYKIAKDLLENGVRNFNVWLSTQVINEFYVNALRKGKSTIDIQNILKEFSDDFNILPISMQTVQKSWQILKKYQFSYWDSLIVAAALETQCQTLYTEDLTNNQIIDDSLKIINPFS